VIERLLPFDVVCVMRERTPLPRIVIERLTNLKLIASTGSVKASIDVAAAGEHGSQWSEKRPKFPLRDASRRTSIVANLSSKRLE
jgi:phosphoglycerate dehydrogenase-like enzyme